MKQSPGYTVAEKDPITRRVVLESIAYEASNYLTICEQIRFAYDTVLQIEDEVIKQDLTEKLIDAFLMGKKMNSRLEKYKRETGSVTGSAGSNLLRIPATRARKRIRGERRP